MAVNQTNIDSYSITELKALAYDITLEMNICRQNLKTIQVRILELANKIKPEQSNNKPEEKKED